MKYIIYKITNKIDGKIYIGKHQTNNIHDSYMGSGKLITRAIDKHGLSNFRKDVLFVYDNEESMNNKEKELVTEAFCERDDVYNICPGGKGGFGYVNSNNLNNYNKDWSSIREKMSKLYKGKKRPYSSEVFKRLHAEGKIPYGLSFKGKKHTEETKAKIGKTISIKQSGKGNSQYGKMWIHNPELKESKRILKDDPIPEGWLKGRKIKF